jgi:hypothetical protein
MYPGINKGRRLNRKVATFSNAKLVLWECESLTCLGFQQLVFKAYVQARDHGYATTTT